MKTYIKDTYINLKTKTLLHSFSGMTELEKKRVYSVLKYISNTNHINETPDHVYNDIKIEGSDNLKNELTKVINESKTYDEIKNKIEGCVTDECLMAHAIIAYHIEPKSLLMLTTAIHTRVKPMLSEGKDGWFDNFSLNSYLYQLTTFVYSDYDKNDDDSVYSVSKPIKIKNKTINNSADKSIVGPEDKKNRPPVQGGLSFNIFGSGSNLINKSQKLNNPQSLLYNLGNLYRTFVEFNIGRKHDIDSMNNNKATEYLDKLVEKYPYFTFQCHGCDCFELSSKTCTIFDIVQFMKRYPRTLVGGILNTETYRSGRGQHWVAVLFLNSTVYLICSQAGNFNDFNDGGNLIKQFNKYGLAQQYNKIRIQNDNSNCGLYSTLSNLFAIIELDRINKTGERFLNLNNIVENIGEDARNINKKGIYKLKEVLIGWSL